MLAAAPVDPGGDFLRVAKSRCVGCHSPTATKVEGDFDYVLDLKKLAADPEKVIPGKPEQSNLFKLTNAGNMPPNNSPTGPLNETQKAAIKRWIAAGAPAALLPPAKETKVPPSSGTAKTEQVPPVVPGPTPEAPPSVLPDTAPDALDATSEKSSPGSGESLVQHFVRWTGELHMLLLHFPIVCLLAAGIAEGRGWWRGQVSASATASFCLWVAALSAVPTVACGLIYAAAGHGLAGAGTLTWHRWLGTSGGAIAILTALVHSHGGMLLLPNQHALARRSFLGVAAALVVAAAHLGGRLTFGPGFLGW